MDSEALARELLQCVGEVWNSTAFSRIFSLSQGESFILNYLLQHPDSVTPGNISDAMKTSTARTAAALRTLEAKGCILRTIDRADRRRVFVELTNIGLKKVEELRSSIFSTATDIVNCLGDDAEEFIRLMEKLTEFSETVGCSEDDKIKSSVSAVNN